MLSFGKILLVLGVVIGVMVVWRWLKARDRDDLPVNRRRAAAKARESLTQDMEPCPSCGTFIPAGTGSCGRSECRQKTRQS